MLKNTSTGSRMKWPFTCFATTDTEIISFNVADLENVAASLDHLANAELDRVVLAVSMAPPLAAAMAASPKLCAELRSCAERSNVLWLGR